MVIVILALSILGFAVGDLLVRVLLQKRQEIKTRREREKILAKSLTLEFATDIPSLKTVTVENPKARILAVDDEEIILDSFRKILVIEGYSVDTVTSGPEALSLVRRNPYDFLFTDLKMPGMDGVEVTKAVKHLRPDMDVVIITGFATIEVAVETMKYGAIEFVQKPFTAEELVTFTHNVVVRREDRRARSTRPVLRVIKHPASNEAEPGMFNVLSGLFVSPSHVWVSLAPNGVVRIGLDDFMQKVFGPFDRLEIGEGVKEAKAGVTGITVQKGKSTACLPIPVSGKVLRRNEMVIENPSLAAVDPFEAGWICEIEASTLAENIAGLRVGDSALRWYETEADRYLALTKGAEPEAEVLFEKFVQSSEG